MNLRQAAQQALEALESAKMNHGKMLLSDPPQEAWRFHRVDETLSDAITALRAALAEPDSDYERGFVDGMNLQTKGSVDKAVNSMAKPITADEMSAWVKDTWEKCQAEAWQEPSGSFVLWENTLCNPLSDPRAMAHSAWHDGYASGVKAEREYIRKQIAMLHDSLSLTGTAIRSRT